MDTMLKLLKQLSDAAYNCATRTKDREMRAWYLALGKQWEREYKELQTVAQKTRSA